MIFLTGETGLLGRHILAQLQHGGDPVIALARSDADAHRLPRGCQPAQLVRRD